MVKAIIFDCFGVVIADGLEAVLLRRETADPGLKDFAMGLVRQSNRGLLDPFEAHEQIAARLGISAAAWRREIYAGETRNEPLIKLIAVLREQYKTALLTNTGRGSLKHRFSDEELQRLFDVVVVSAEIGLAKPDTEIYEHAAKKLGVTAAACVFVDDRRPHVAGAERAGMQAILYEDFEQMRGELERLLTADTKG